jgi:hypothetical protein
VAAKRLQEGLKAAAHGAAEGPAVNLDLDDAGRPLDLAGRRHADEEHLHSLERQLICHVLDAMAYARPRNRRNRGFGT